MKRTINFIDGAKWYHFETLKKYFKGFDVDKSIITDAEEKAFTMILFKRRWQRFKFFVHPKHKRLKSVDSYEVCEEIGFKRRFQ